MLGHSLSINIKETETSYTENEYRNELLAVICLENFYFFVYNLKYSLLTVII